MSRHERLRACRLAADPAVSAEAVMASLHQQMSLLTDVFDREAPLSYVAAFLRIAHAGDVGVDQGRLQEELGMSSSGISRTIQALSDVHWLKDRPGLKLVERMLDPTDNRRRALRLSPAGRALLHRLEVSPLE
jgi:DNA-binding MarR family transcriptional regulator